MSKHDILRDQLIKAICDALEPIALREESAGVGYRDFAVPLLQALEYHVGLTIAAVDDVSVQLRLIDCFQQSVPRQVAFHSNINATVGQRH